VVRSLVIALPLAMAAAKAKPLVGASSGNYPSPTRPENKPLRHLPASLALLLLAACDGGTDTPRGGPPPSAWSGPRTAAETPTGQLDRSFAGTPAPASGFQDPDGETVSLADFRGRPLLVNLWATWCAPCIAEMPTLDALAAREKGLRVLAVSQDLEGTDKVDAFFAKRPFQMLQPYIDPKLALMTELKVDTLPTTILYDAQGREVWRMTGMEDWEVRRAAGLLKEAG
jgi:thiol-disulfide isomerase/thioredoxin